MRQRIDDNLTKKTRIEWMIRVEYRAARLGGCWLVMSSDLQTLIDADRAANKNFEAHLDQLANAEDAHEFYSPQRALPSSKPTKRWWL